MKASVGLYLSTSQGKASLGYKVRYGNSVLREPISTIVFACEQTLDGSLAGGGYVAVVEKSMLSRIERI